MGERSACGASRCGRRSGGPRDDVLNLTWSSSYVSFFVCVLVPNFGFRLGPHLGRRLAAANVFPIIGEETAGLREPSSPNVSL